MVELLAEMELKGISVNRRLLNEMSNSLGLRLADLETKIYNLADQKFNIGSPKQLGEILFIQMSPIQYLHN